MKYDITYNGEVCGTAYIQRAGLYWKIECECRIETQDFLQIYTETEKKRTCLGLLVPERGRLVLRKNIPCKNLSLEGIRFYVAKKIQKHDIPFAPIYPEEPFEYLQRLKYSRMEIKGGIKGIYLFPDQPDNDLIPEFQDR